MFGKGGHRAGAQVRGGAHIQGQLGGGQVLDKGRIRQASDAVTDPFGAKAPDRRPHPVRTVGLAGVRDAVQAGGAGAIEQLGERRPVDFDPADVETDDTVQVRGKHRVEGRFTRGNAPLPGEVGHPAQLDPMCGLGREAPSLDTGEHRFGRHSSVDVRPRGEGHLGKADPE